jgi:hydroxypyruvate reductase
MAGARLLAFLHDAPTEATMLFLISGGASSLVEVLPPAMSLAELQQVNRWLMGSGWDIHRMNVLRKRLSAIKGGRLAAWLKGQRTVQLLISDVPGDDPGDIGSGLLIPDDGAAVEGPSLPEWLHDLLRRIPPSPLPPPAAFAAVETHIVASLDQALSAAAAAAHRQGYQVWRDAQRLHGEAAATGRRLARTLIDGAPGIYLWGGETTMCLPAMPGRGGRNQHLALAAAEVLAGHDKVWLLAAGSDGSDGPGADAGALVDGGTVARGGLDGLDAADCLRRADAGSFLAASGDLINTGPTGTNVMDVVIGLKR